MPPIFSQSPNNWKELQKKVAKVFSDMGYDTDIKKDINTVRGKVNVDVFATKKAIGSVKQSLLNANNGIER